MTLTPGTRLGIYEVAAQIGEGGMGQVFRATDTKLKRQVAIKILPPSLAADHDRLARFQREAEVLASLNHPNIAAIYGLEERDGVSALVMEFVDGEDLSQRIVRGAVPADEAVAIARQIAEALEAAHEQGIIHRDLKPANIKVRSDGTVKVLDFGLAKALLPDEPGGAANAANSPTLTSHGTRLGVILGTAAYMSPEQARGRAVDRRADIWAFGVVLYEMLAGRSAYPGEDVSETMAAVLTREVDYTALPAATPARLRQLVTDCLVRDPKQRLRDIGDARRALDQVIHGVPADAAVSATGGGGRRTSGMSVALAWAITALAVLSAVAVAWQSRARAVEAPRIVTRSKMLIPGLAGFLGVSPNGSHVAYSVNGQDSYQLYLKALDQFTAEAMPGTDGGEFPVFSPDGAWMAFSDRSNERMLKKIPVAGGPTFTIGPGWFAGGGDWGPGDTIVYSAAQGLVKISASGGAASPLTTIDTGSGETIHNRPQFLPGNRLLFTVISKSPESPQFAVLDLKRGTRRIVARGGFNGRYLPSGHLTFVRQGTLFAVPFDLDRLVATGPEVPLIEGISTLGPPGTADYAVSKTGMLLYMESGINGTLFSWANRSGASQTIAALVPREGRVGGRLSPDGRRMITSVVAANVADLWMIDLERGVETRLTFSGSNEDPVWTPDGRTIVFALRRSARPGIYSMLAEGGRAELLFASDSSARPTSISRDGATLLYTEVGAPPSRPRVMVWPLRGTQRTPHPLRESDAEDSQAQFSPDGQWVALTSTETGAREVYLVRFPDGGAKVRVSIGGGQQPRWADNGRELLFWSSRRGDAKLMSVSVSSSDPLVLGTPRALFGTLPPSIWDVAPDGRFLLETVPAAQAGSVMVTVTNWFDELRRRAPARQ